MGDSEFVGLGGVGVVGFDLFEVSLEDESSVGLFSGFERSAELSFPLTEGINFGVVFDVDGRDGGEGDQSSNQDLFVHFLDRFITDYES